MKRTLISLLALLPLVAFAQYNPETFRTPVAQPSQRADIILPTIDGYNIYKTDLHTHSVYSDGDVTPAFRVREAYYDGLDAVAITEHLEYRRHEGNMLKFLKGYTDGKVLKAKNTDLIRHQCPKDGIMSDQNYPVEEAVRESKKFGVLVIPGTEITREPVEIGHFNALFTTDNNTVYDPDPLQSIRNAKAQGAVIQHNHPGWRRTTCAKTKFEVKAYNEGLIDGIEVANGGSLYTTVINRAFDENLYVAANTDIHIGTAEYYRMKGQLRNMTLILAKECTLEALKEALLAKRTLAYSGGYITGAEDLLCKLFLGSVKYEIISSGKGGGCTITLTNMSSFAYTFKTSENANPITIKPFNTIQMSVDKSRTLKLTITNMFCGLNTNPTATLKVE